MSRPATFNGRLGSHELPDLDNIVKQKTTYYGSGFPPLNFAPVT